MPLAYIQTSLRETSIWALQALLSYLEGHPETTPRNQQTADEQGNGEAANSELASSMGARGHPQTRTCTTCTLINTANQTLCDACESPSRKMDFSSMIILHGSSANQSSLTITSESKERVQDKRWLIDVKNAAFPPEHVAWLNRYERSPDEPLMQTYRKGIIQQELGHSAHTIPIGIVFLEGASRPAVAYAELNRETRGEPDQRSPEWRVATAATLLKRFDVKDDLTIIRPDDSSRIMRENKNKEPQRKRLPYEEHGESRMTPVVVYGLF